MSIATALFLNAGAVVALLGLLTATMRLPYHMRTTPRDGVATRSERARRTHAVPAGSRARPERGAPEPVFSR